MASTRAPVSRTDSSLAGCDDPLGSAPPATGSAAGSSGGSPVSGAVGFITCAIFLASGAAGLIYEVTWTRQLLYIFGAGLYAVTAVLAAFMGGLALGAWLLGRFADRMRRPLAAYALLEFAIGGCGFALPHLLSRVHFVDGWAYEHWGQDFALLTGFRFAVSLALMLVPTTLMGATLPVLSRFLVRNPGHLGSRVGWLYAVNTFGAVSGAFLAGFLLIGRYGLYPTQHVAAVLNCSVGIVALVLSPFLDRSVRPAIKPPPKPKPAPAPAPAPAAGSEAGGEGGDAPKAEPVPPPPAPPPPPRPPFRPKRSGLARWILTTAFLSGIVSLAAQVLWSRSLVFVFEFLKNTTYSFSAMLTVFLAGLAIGSALIGPFVDRLREPLRLYGTLLAFIGLSIALSALTLVGGARMFKLAQPYDAATGELNWVLAVGNILLQTFGVLGIPTLLMGMAFPVAARIVSRLDCVGCDVGALYSLNTVGAIIGAIAAAFLIVPRFGLTDGLLLLGGADLILGLITIGLAPGGRRQLGWVIPLAVVLMSSVMWRVSGDEAARLQPMAPGDREMSFYEEGSLATVSVIENALRDRTIYVDGVGVAGTDLILQTDQKSLAHIPMMLLRRPAQALTVGFGSGGASYSLLLHDRLRRVDCVEICPTVLDAAPQMAAANHNFFGNDNPLAFARADERYNIIVDDARAWLRYTDVDYDFIATDCTDLRYKSNANLYDIEYFQACRDRLTEEGIVVVWMPLGGMSEEIFKTALRTFHAVFPEMGIFYMNNESTHYILLVGWQDKVRLEYSLFATTLAETDVREDLSILRLDDPVKLLSCFITGGERLADWLGDGPLNTENHPLIEFESPKYGFGDTPMLDNLDSLMAIRVSPRRYLDPTGIPPEALDQLERYERALPHIIEGHSHYRNIEREGILEGMEAAARAWMAAKEIAPEDISLRRLLQFPIVSQRLENERNVPLWSMLFGRVYMIQDERHKQDLAYDALRHAERLLREMRQLEGQDKASIDGQLSQVQGWLDTIRRSQQDSIN